MSVATHSLVLNGKKVRVDIEHNVRMLWVLRDGTGARGPVHGCGTGVCQGCTSHLKGDDADPCAAPLSDVDGTDRTTTIEGLAKSTKKNLHPVHAARGGHDVAQCGYCQPGQLSAATALINRVRKSGRKISDVDLDALRNVCRCGTYPGIRETVRLAASTM